MTGRANFVVAGIGGGDGETEDGSWGRNATGGEGSGEGMLRDEIAVYEYRAGDCDGPKGADSGTGRGRVSCEIDGSVDLRDRAGESCVNSREGRRKGST